MFALRVYPNRIYSESVFLLTLESLSSKLTFEMNVSEKKRTKGLPGLRAKRQSRGLSISTLADRVGCRFNHLWRIENGKATGSADLIERLRDELECSYDDLFLGEEVAS